MRPRFARFAVTVVGLSVVSGCRSAETVPIRLQLAGHSVQVRDLGQGVCEVRTTGPDPYVVCERVEQRFDHDRVFVLAFEYVCPEGVDFFEVYWGNPFHGGANVTIKDIPAATDWAPFAANLKMRGDEWDESVQDFRIDFGGDGGRLIKVRNVHLRAMTPEEELVRVRRENEARKELMEKADRVNASLIAPARIEDTSNMMAATEVLTADGATTAISVLGRELDLVTQVRESADSVPPPVDLGPRIVAGEGPDPANHTVVRILNRYGLCEVQFLAYPPEVRGGVWVECGKAIGGEECIVTAPIADPDVRELRVFSRHGNLLRAIPVPDQLKPPFVLAVGDFAPDRTGDEIAVAPRTTTGGPLPLVVLTGEGQVLRSVVLSPDSSVAPSRLARGRSLVPLGAVLPAGGVSLVADGQDGAEGLILHAAGSAGFHRVDPVAGRAEWVDAKLAGNCAAVFPSASARHQYAATVEEPLHSSLCRIKPGAGALRQNVGARENLFWFNATGAYKDVPEGRYVRHSLFAHIRTDFGSPNASTPDFGSVDPNFWAGDAYRARVTSRLSTYDTDPPVCWEPCFTHRWFYGQARTWAAAEDEETGLPAYTLIDRENTTGTYGEFGRKKSFVSGTYAPGVRPIECFYTYPLRLFLHELVARFRRNPEHFVGVEPNHEMEINAESKSTHGDYNPNMIRAFHRYLLSLYGSLDGINTVFGASFSPERFDAPRGLGRGTWDVYSTDNPYYMVWMRFMNYVIYRVVAGTYREALLAGFPPEAIKCHQIPDHYAISSLSVFSKPAQRVTPIDWNLNAGVGYGFTRYGVWFNREHNCVQGAYSSGFDTTVIGEYQSLTPDADLARKQLEYMQAHGVSFIHCMNWPKSHDRGYNKALAEALTGLVKVDRPRPGVTGGTGQVRVARREGVGYDIVSIGTGPEHTGLLKSVTPDGSWDGRVYVVPFHSHVRVVPVLDRSALALGRKPLVLGPFAGVGAGNVFELSFMARVERPASVNLDMLHHGIELPEQRLSVPLGPEWRHVRLLVRVQVDTDDLVLRLGVARGEGQQAKRVNVELRDVLGVRHAEQTTRLKKGVFAGQRHRGGVTFDVMDSQ